MSQAHEHCTAVTVRPSEGIQTPSMQPVIIRGISEYVVRTDSVKVCIWYVYVCVYACLCVVFLVCVYVYVYIYMCHVYVCMMCVRLGMG